MSVIISWFDQNKGVSMKKIAILSIFFLALAAPVCADFNSGFDAFLNEDYRMALGEFRPLAEQGNADAQYMLGYMYAAGKGVLQDYVLAHTWFNLAAALGNAKAATARDKIAQVMTTGQIAEAQKLAREWSPKQMAEKPPATEEPSPASGNHARESGSPASIATTSTHACLAAGCGRGARKVMVDSS